MGQYMLQLVQTLKYEPYLDNPLARLLLRRVLLNRKLGHFFFWHLKSELQNPSLFLKLGLILEAYCRGLGPYLKDLIRMVEALDKLTTLTDSIKKDRPQVMMIFSNSYFFKYLRQLTKWGFYQKEVDPRTKFLSFY